MATVYGEYRYFDSGNGWWRTKVDYSGTSATVTLQVKSGYTVFVKITGKINGTAESKLSYSSNATSTYTYPSTFTISETASNTIALTCTNGTWGQNGTSTATIPQQKGSFNLNVLNPDGSEPYSTGEAGSVERSINGGTYERKYNEDASSYAIGTTFNYRNFTPGTGRYLSSVSGVSPNNTTGPWSATMTASGLSINFSTAWQTYSIAYNAGGGSGAPSSQTKTYGTNLTLSSTQPTRGNSTATGYTITFNGNGGTPSKSSQAATDTTTYTFKNWKATNGTTYSPGGTYSANEATTLTAQWDTSVSKGSITAATATRSNGTSACQVHFDTSGGNSVSSINSTATITYACNGWYTASSGGTKRVDSGGTFTPSATETLYAQWSQSTGTYSSITLPSATKNNTNNYYYININGNGGNTPSQLTSTQTIKYSMNGWFDGATSTNKIGNVGDNYTPTATKTLYAQFSTSSSPYSPIDLPTAEECSYDGFILKGFSDKPDGTILYSPGENIIPSSDMTLYAIWESGQAKVKLKTTTGWKEGKLYIKHQGHWCEAKQVFIKQNNTWTQGINS